MYICIYTSASCPPYIRATIHTTGNGCPSLLRGRSNTTGITVVLHTDNNRRALAVYYSGTHYSGTHCVGSVVMYECYLTRNVSSRRMHYNARRTMGLHCTAYNSCSVQCTERPLLIEIVKST